MARVLRVSASGYDAWRRRPASAHATSDAALLRRIRTIHAASHGTNGAPRVHAELRAEGTVVARKRVARLMRGARPRAWEILTRNSGATSRPRSPPSTAANTRSCRSCEYAWPDRHVIAAFGSSSGGR
ncbi:IS3 family transposase [Rubritepida flocculans]|jgi:hypothetical protein|uniref:IS3 family transposase n=1 Tax=Rubritepida flocculans TaxID=182403 RepID=UPI0009FEC442|nr:IS3 family transposase [Rubritepida flocculans]